MPSLTDQDKKRARYHLGYNEAVLDGDRLLLEDRVSNLIDSEWVGRISERLNRCDRALTESEDGAAVLDQVGSTTYTGDLNRVQVQRQARPFRDRQKVYMAEVDALARDLGVPNARSSEYFAASDYRVGVRLERRGYLIQEADAQTIAQFGPANLALSALRVVAMVGGELVYASADNPTTAYSIAGLLLQSGGAGNSPQVLPRGLHSDPAWAWNSGEPIWLGLAGGLTQTTPSSDFLLQVAWPLSAVQIDFDPKIPIFM